MNIFAIDNDPVQAARWLVDKHMKMMLEGCQILCTLFHKQGIEAPYRKTHENHPSTLWAGRTNDNLQWTIDHAHEISNEYTSRYGKIHKSLKVLKWCDTNKHRLGFDQDGLQKFSLAINSDSICRTLDEWDESDSVNCYRLFYKHDKAHLHQWKRNKPEWI